jgi:hypothetical protein
MARPLTCDEHPEIVGALLIQNLAEGGILVACPECVPDMVLNLAQITGVAAAIAETAQQELYEQVAAQSKPPAKPRARKAAPSATAPKDTDPVGESTATPPQEE